MDHRRILQSGDRVSNRITVAGLLGLLWALVAAFPASAVGASGSGVTDFSTPGLLSFDLSIATLGAQVVTVDVGDESGTSIGFNAILSNALAAPWSFLEVEVDAGAELAILGEAGEPVSGTRFTVARLDATRARIDFAPNEARTVGGIDLGDPLTFGELEDWSIDLSGVGGTTFTLTILPTYVPEPGPALLIVSGLVGLAFEARSAKRGRAREIDTRRAS